MDLDPVESHEDVPSSLKHWISVARFVAIEPLASKVARSAGFSAPRAQEFEFLEVELMERRVSIEKFASLKIAKFDEFPWILQALEHLVMITIRNIGS